MVHLIIYLFVQHKKKKKIIYYLSCLLAFHYFFSNNNVVTFRKIEQRCWNKFTSTSKCKMIEVWLFFGMLLIFKFQFLQGDQPFGHSFWNHMYVSHASQLLPNDLLATFTNHIFHDINKHKIKIQSIAN